MPKNCLASTFLICSWIATATLASRNGPNTRQRFNYATLMVAFPHLYPSLKGPANSGGEGTILFISLCQNRKKLNFVCFLFSFVRRRFLQT